MKVNKPKKQKSTAENSVDWLGLGTQAAIVAMRGTNFALRQMITLTAGRLDVAESQLRVGYGRHMGEWGWIAVVRKNDTEHLGPVSSDPMHAMAALVDKIEEQGGKDD